VAKRTFLYDLPGMEAMSCLFIPQGGDCIYGYDGTEITRHDLKGKCLERTPVSAANSPYTLAAAPDGAHFAIGGSRWLRVFDAQGKLIKAFRANKGRMPYYFTPDSSSVCCALESTLTYFDLKGRKVAWTRDFAGRFGASIQKIAPLPGSPLVIALTDTELKFVDTRSGVVVHEKKGLYYDFSVSPDGCYLALVDRRYHQEDLVIQETHTGEIAAKRQGGGYRRLQWSGDGRLLACGRVDGPVDVFDFKMEPDPVPPAKHDAKDLCSDPGKAFSLRMNMTPDRADPLLRDLAIKNWLPVIDADELKAILKGMGAKEFPTRVKSQELLEALGPRIKWLVRAELANPDLGLEVRKRLEAVSSKWVWPLISAEEMPLLRLACILERDGSKKALHMLNEIHNLNGNLHLREIVGALRSLKNP